MAQGDTTLLASLTTRERKKLLAEDTAAPFFMLSIERKLSGSIGSRESFDALLAALPGMTGPLARESILLLAVDFRQRYLAADSHARKKSLKRLWRKLIRPLFEDAQVYIGEDVALRNAQEELLVLMGTEDRVLSSLDRLLMDELTASLVRQRDFPAFEAVLENRSEWERDLIQARLLLWDREYGPAKEAFDRLRQQDDKRFFALSPKVLADYGRAVQYGGTAEWGARVFPGFDARIAGGQDFEADELEARRFVFLFFAGRMQRQTGNHDEARRLFTQSLVFAPDVIQRDAVLWYLLEAAFRDETDKLMSGFTEFMPLVHDRDSFSGLWDRLQGRLLSEERYEDITRSHQLIQAWGNSTARIRSSWISARLVDLGYLPADRARVLLNISVSSTLREWTESRYHAIFEEDTASFYYRSLAAIILGKSVKPVPDSLADAPDAASMSSQSSMERNRHPFDSATWTDEDWTDWLTACERWGQTTILEGFASRYKHLIPADIVRDMARIQAERGDSYQSIRTIGTLLGRPDYRLSREDFMLLYPRAWQHELDTAAMVWGVPPEIMAGLARSESAFRAEVISHAGAVGLVQIMPATGRDIASRIAKRVPLVMEGDDPVLSDAFTNAQLGAWYLADWTKRLSSPMLALFAYNAGPGRVRQWRTARPDLPEDLFLETVPFDETRNYGRRVLAAAAVYGYLYYGYDMAQVAKDLFGAESLFTVRSAQ